MRAPGGENDTDKKVGLALIYAGCREKNLYFYWADTIFFTWNGLMNVMWCEFTERGFAFHHSSQSPTVSGMIIYLEKGLIAISALFSDCTYNQ